MNRRSLLLGLRLGVFAVLLSMTSQALAFFPPDNINIVPPPPPVQPHVNPPPDHCCCCDCPPPTNPQVQTTPEPMTIVTGLIGVTMLGIFGLRKRFLGSEWC